MGKRTLSLILTIVAMLFGLYTKADFSRTNSVNVATAIRSASRTAQPATSTPDSPDGAVAVVRVVDGDTIVVKDGDVDEKVRLLGINTPETVDPRRPVQCFGKEASNKTKELLQGQKVILKSDATQGDRDKYGRLLRYVYLPDGMFINKVLIEEGYAYEYTYHTPYKFQAEFKEAQKQAQTDKRGLWADGVCE